MPGRLGRRVPDLAALLAVVAGVALVMVGAQSAPARLRAEPDQFVNLDRPRLIDSHNSPALAVNPLDPDEMALTDRSESPRFACSFYRSFDGGGSWRAMPVELAPETEICFWPDVSFDGDGNLLVLYTSLTGRYNHPNAVWLQRYRGVRPDGPPVRVTTDIAFHPRIAAVDRTVFVTWVRAGAATLDKPLGLAPAPNPVVLARSDDGGATFAEPVAVSEAERFVVQPDVLPGDGREVIVAGLDMVDDVANYEGTHDGQTGPAPEGVWRVVSWRSTDGGMTFGPAAVAGELTIPRRVVVDLGPAPSMARQRSGPIYAAWDGGQGDSRDVFLSSSVDGGRHWTPPRTVAGGRGAQFLPAVAVAPDGRVDVAFYDRSGDRDDVRADVVVKSSWDGGRSFVGTEVSDAPSDTRIATSGFSGITELGSQSALVAQRDRAIAVWTDTRRATADNVAQDLASARVDVQRAEEPRGLLVALGVAMVVGGVVIAARRPRRPSKLSRDR